MRLAALAILACIAWLVLSFTLQQSPRPELLNNIDQMIADQPQILYLGDSSLFTAAESDTDKRSIPKLLQEQLPDFTIGSLHEAAFNMDMFMRILRYIQQDDYRPRLLILPINLRTYSPLWQYRPEWQFVALKLDLEHDSTLFRSFYEPLAVFKALKMQPVSMSAFHEEVTKTLKDSYRVLKREDDIPPGFGPGGVPRLDDAQRFAVTYAYPLSRTHPQMMALEQIIDLAHDMDLALFFYITPIDVRTGEELHGAQFNGAQFNVVLQQNLALIETVLSQKGETALDLHNLISDAKFGHVHDAFLEHYPAKGRKTIAEAIAKHINSVQLIQVN
jgi:hypothetical protein